MCNLSQKAKQLLKKAANCQGQIVKDSYLNSLAIFVCSERFEVAKGHKGIKLLLDVIDELVRCGYIAGNDDVFEVTAAGYRVADKFP